MSRGMKDLATKLAIHESKPKSQFPWNLSRRSDVCKTKFIISVFNELILENKVALEFFETRSLKKFSSLMIEPFWNCDFFLFQSEKSFNLAGVVKYKETMFWKKAVNFQDPNINNIKK